MRHQRGLAGLRATGHRHIDDAGFPPGTQLLGSLFKARARRIRGIRHPPGGTIFEAWARRIRGIRHPPGGTITRGRRRRRGKGVVDQRGIYHFPCDGGVTVLGVLRGSFLRRPPLFFLPHVFPHRRALLLQFQLESGESLCPGNAPLFFSFVVFGIREFLFRAAAFVIVGQTDRKGAIIYQSTLSTPLVTEIWQVFAAGVCPTIMRRAKTSRKRAPPKPLANTLCQNLSQARCAKASRNFVAPNYPQLPPPFGKENT